jgi:hypothetical protein
MLLRSGTSDGVLLHPRWSREHNGGGSGGCYRGNVSDVGVLLALISCFGLAFASAFTMLALGLAIRTLLLLLLLLLLVRPLLVAPVWVAMLALHHADLIGIVLLRTMVHRVCLVLYDNCSVHVAEDQILKRVVTSDNRDHHLPFLRECSKGNHCVTTKDGNP